MKFYSDIPGFVDPGFLITNGTSNYLIGCKRKKGAYCRTSALFSAGNLKKIAI